jgi:serine/threonine protein kinase
MNRYNRTCIIPNIITNKQRRTAAENTQKGFCNLPKGYIINSRYTVKKILGEGGYSIVYLVEDNTTDNFFAMKISKSLERHKSSYNDTSSEIAKFALVSESEYFIQMIDNFDFLYNSLTYKCIVMELVGCDIFQIIKKYEYKGLPNFLAKNIIREVTKGLEFLNSKNLGHFDLKPENICLAISREDAIKFSELDDNDDRSQCEFLKDVSCDIKIKIIDLGGILDTTTEIDFLPTTVDYRAYEGILNEYLIDNQQIESNVMYDNNYHIFSLGCILFELITGNQLFRNYRDYESDHIHRIRQMYPDDQLALVDSTIGVIPNDISMMEKVSLNTILRYETDDYPLYDIDYTLLNELLLGMLTPNPLTRIKPADILTSRWLNDETDYYDETDYSTYPSYTPPSYTPSAVTPPSYTPPSYTPSAYTPSAYTPSAYTPSAYTPSAVTPSAYTPSSYTPSAVTPSAVTPSTYTPPSYTPSSYTPSAVTPSSYTPSSYTPPAVTPSAVTPSAVTPSAVTPSAVTPSAVTPSAVTPSAVTPSAVTPSAVVVTADSFKEYMNQKYLKYKEKYLQLK